MPNYLDLENITPEDKAALRAIVLGPQAEIDDSGNLSVGGNLSVDGATWAGKGVVLAPVAVSELATHGGIQIVHDALNPELGQPVVAGGTSAVMVRLDAGVYRVIA